MITGHIIKSNGRLSSSSSLSQRVISRNQEEISKLESQRDILEKKIMVPNEIEQEYQSNK